MNDAVEERAIKLGEYIVETGATVRQAAKQFCTSKSTVHKDVTQRLSEINAELAKEVRLVLENNKAERHIRGGLATKEKYDMGMIVSKRKKKAKEYKKENA